MMWFLVKHWDNYTFTLLPCNPHYNVFISMLLRRFFGYIRHIFTT